MGNVVERAQAVIRAILCAAVVERPLDPGLSVEEIRTVALTTGVGVGAFDAALNQTHGLLKDRSRRLLANHDCWGEVALAGFVKVPDEIRPSAVLGALSPVFDELDNSMGPRVRKDLVLIRAHVTAHPTAEVDRALGLLVSLGFLDRHDEGFLRNRPWPDYGVRANEFETKRTADIIAVLPAVRDVLAMRVGGHVPGEPPIERFGAFLKKQGWTAFETWWGLTATEMRAMTESRHTSSICVLAGALLEASLVAIAHPAVQAGQWRNKFLQKPPEAWWFKDLIEQAESAGTFSGPQAALASSLAEVRNRIHAGRFSTAGTTPFKPPYSNVHDARLAREHLDHLLNAILEWPTVKALT